ncbi:MAG: alanine dehydrogenase [Saprospiraceae bacterium]|nr:alanine dehydrogenase [Saprospiraceae bacterium]
MDLSNSEQLLPQEEMLEVTKKKSSLTIGVPKETSYQEHRVGLAPQMVALLVENGHEIFIESDAGKAAHFDNKEYSEAGAQIVYTVDEVFKCDIILKVAPPSIDEINLAKPRQTIFSALHLTAQNIDYFKALSKKKITAISFEHIKDKTNSYPIMRSLSEIAGTTAVLIAAEYLSHPTYGKGKMLGGFSGIAPSEVVIIGAGNVGEFATRAALGLGASVKVFDNAIYKLKSIQNNLNTRIYTSAIQPDKLAYAIYSADVVIGAIHALNGSSPLVVTEAMVKGMKEGSVIVDLSIDQGGCFETSEVTDHKNPVFQKFGVTHYCVPNIASRVPHTATYALSNYFGPIMLKTGDEGGINAMLKADPCVRKGVYMFNGTLTNKYISDYYRLPHKDIDLLMSPFLG